MCDARHTCVVFKEEMESCHVLLVTPTKIFRSADGCLVWKRKRNFGELVIVCVWNWKGKTMTVTFG